MRVAPDAATVETMDQHLGSFDVIGFAALFAAIAWHSARGVARQDTFLVADRAVGLFPLVATLVMTEFNTSTLLAFSAIGYSAGPMALALPLVFLVGLGFYTLTVARSWKRFDRLSVAELFAVRYSRALGRFASLMLLAAMSGFAATYVKSLGLIFHPMIAAVPFPVLTAVLTLAVLLVVLPGGLTSVVRSDVVSFLVTIVLLPALLVIGTCAQQRPGRPRRGVSRRPVAGRAAGAVDPSGAAVLVRDLADGPDLLHLHRGPVVRAEDVRGQGCAHRGGGGGDLGLSGLRALWSDGSGSAHTCMSTTPRLADPQLAVPAMMMLWLPPGDQGRAGWRVLFAASLTDARRRVERDGGDGRGRFRLDRRPRGERPAARCSPGLQ